ncbi:hypothetical protein WR25_08462 [Diploscapter pachys]|uniref:Carbonic anhydrase n=1 Tax=Diploscapter pachys TaxID=2018661 RepID=A0A2A2L5A8_9BILA|nr:hypothetical protein WR25_08462 [Diploscapter pachys]
MELFECWERIHRIGATTGRMGHKLGKASAMSESPIDIRLSEVDYALIHRVHLLHYDFSGPVEMTNNGRTLVMTGFDKWDGGRKQPIMRGGGLKHTYRLIQLHLHWGHSHGHGSEHTLNGLSYPAELHLVHVREGLDVGKASNVKDGLAVLGVWFVEGENDSNFAQISDNLHYLLFDGNRTSLDKFYPRRLLPERTASFYRYEGSLTTPGCSITIYYAY